MYKYVARRLLMSIPVVVLSSLIVFGLMRVMPGDALTALMGESGNDDLPSHRVREGGDDRKDRSWEPDLVGERGGVDDRGPGGLLELDRQEAVVEGIAGGVADLGGQVAAGTRRAERRIDVHQIHPARVDHVVDQRCGLRA